MSKNDKSSQTPSFKPRTQKNEDAIIELKD
jgi:hypothetical protein